MRIGIGALVGIVGRAGHLRPRAGRARWRGSGDTTTSCSPTGPAQFAGVDVGARARAAGHDLSPGDVGPRPPARARSPRTASRSITARRTCCPGGSACRAWSRCTTWRSTPVRRPSRGRSACTSASRVPPSVARAARVIADSDARARGPGRALRPRLRRAFRSCRWRCRRRSARHRRRRRRSRPLRARHGLGDRGSSPASGRSSRASASSASSRRSCAREGAARGWELAIAGRLRPGYAPPWLQRAAAGRALARPARRRRAPRALRRGRRSR